MKNKLTDLNNHLFAQLERLSDESIKGDELKQEIARGKAVAGVAAQLIEVGKLALDAAKFQQDFGRQGALPPMLEDNSK